MTETANESGLVTQSSSKKLSKLKDRSVAEDITSMAVHDLTAWKGIYRLCIELRNFEISQLVQRNNFFMIFQGVLFAGVCQSAGAIPIVSFLVCVAGLAVSILQAFMAAGAKYWQVHWEINTQKSEEAMMKVAQFHRVLRWQVRKHHGKDFDDELMAKIENRGLLAHLFTEDSNSELIEKSLKESRPKALFLNWFIMQRFSSSRIPIYTGLFLSAIWLVLTLSTIHLDGWSFSIPEWIVGFPAK